MIRIVVDEAISEKLTELGDSAELRDASGRLLGYFHPVEDDDYEGYDSPLPEAELAQRTEKEAAEHWAKSSPTWKSGHEVHGRLGSPG